ncbi:hypothetical protein AB0E85_08460 [Streptomyces sp. NPDC029044]|uniref:hypothetical protein n=1 Tax=Streptomyces sp. NPDC029044 TaxID=3157198 RepID=UPI0033C72C20
MTASAPVHGTREPQPAARWEGAFPTGDGRHGALVCGDPHAERAVVTRRVELRAPSGTESLHLVAGEGHVLTLRTW